ncbi:geranylgeranyl pyrophosphate synthase [Gigaspora margarita]|uniref:Geranylgeranyl pyrophosphate synthase n=1 Tax=Gigaspora margarita TaxID=4874 RepID=A0A8H4AXK6_GIGMA|nr:geranylgeranyl pyrophosphate synthase [Gigaspora margarita]
MNQNGVEKKMNRNGIEKKRKLDCSTARSALYSLSTEEILLEPYNYLLSLPGQKTRSKLIEAFNHWLNVPEDKLSAIATVVEMLHAASILIDDVEDYSVLRRGVPVAHTIFGVPATINCANYVYFLALHEITKFDNPEMHKIYTSELLNLHHGQGMELYWRDSMTCPSEAEYINMVLNKTGGLLRLAVRLMQQCSESKIDYVPLVNDISVHFQICDDYMNLQSKKHTDSKGFCEDLTEGKFSFPIMHSIHTGNNDNRLMNILKQHSNSIELKQYAVKIMKENGSFEYTRNYLKKTENMIQEKIEKLGGNPVIEKMNLLKIDS